MFASKELTLLASIRESIFSALPQPRRNTATNPCCCNSSCAFTVLLCCQSASILVLANTRRSSCQAMPTTAEVPNNANIATAALVSMSQSFIRISTKPGSDNQAVPAIAPRISASNIHSHFIIGQPVSDLPISTPWSDHRVLALGRVAITHLVRLCYLRLQQNWYR